MKCDKEFLQDEIRYQTDGYDMYVLRKSKANDYMRDKVNGVNTFFLTAHHKHYDELYRFAKQQCIEINAVPTSSIFWTRKGYYKQVLKELQATILAQN